jgi:Rps23 Pro-64 3,4-dihydroxylase Tpa1-like proline 4-hydroxylase
MTDDSILNLSHFSTPATGRFASAFNEASPFRHLVIDNFLAPAFADSLANGFPALEKMRTHYSGINERKAEDNDLTRLDSNFTLLHQTLSAPHFLQWLSEVTGIAKLRTVEDRLGYGLHQGGDGSFLDIHIDYNIHPITKLQRKLNFLLFFNPGWNDEWGGLLQFWDARSENTGQEIAPLFNRAVIFECSEISYHGCSKVHVPHGITRKSIYQYYFTTPDKAVHYHDTIFKPVPGTPLAKKIVVPVKELLKNGIKKTLLSLGLERFLR